MERKLGVYYRSAKEKKIGLISPQIAWVVIENDKVKNCKKSQNNLHKTLCLAIMLLLINVFNTEESNNYCHFIFFKQKKQIVLIVPVTDTRHSSIVNQIESRKAMTQKCQWCGTCKQWRLIRLHNMCSLINLYCLHYESTACSLCVEGGRHDYFYFVTVYGPRHVIYWYHCHFSLPW